VPIWLTTLIPYIWKFLKHWGVYILITIILVGGPYLLYRHGYNNGWKSKVCPPTYSVGDGGTVNNYLADDYKLVGIKVKFLFLKLHLGY
jgi:hypothetical protein